MSNNSKAIWDEFILWSQKSLSERGKVDTEVAWAEAHSLTTRTLRRWKTLPEFEARRLELVGSVVEPKSLAADTGTGVAASDEADYFVVKAALLEGAKNGNPKYLDLYFKTYGKPFVEEEAASRASDLSVVELEELVLRAVEAVGVEMVVKHLEGLGWECVRGDDRSARV
jgi:hypothetical protein